MTLPRCTDTMWRLNRGGSSTLQVTTQNAQISDLRLTSASCWLPRHIGRSARWIPRPAAHAGWRNADAAGGRSRRAAARDQV